jgi:ankyrin repeat protein
VPDTVPKSSSLRVSAMFIFQEKSATPLHLATRSGDTESVRTLVGAGADVAKRDGVRPESQGMAVGH